ncbi:MAG: nuclear transport factor 2 family protein [Actinomycetota bacterium]
MRTQADVVRRIYDGFARGDVAAVLGAFDAEIEWREAEGFHYAEGNPYIGPDAVASGVFQRLMSDLPLFEVFTERFIDGGNTVVVEGRYSGKTKRGRLIDAPFAHVWELRDAKVVRFQQYTDTRHWTEVFA